MKNQELARIFFSMSELLEVDGVQWEPRAYSKAAIYIRQLKTDIAKIAKKGELQAIPGVGRAIAKKIEEYLETGKVEAYEELKERIPHEVVELLRLPGIGPKRFKLFREELNIHSIADLEAAIKEHKLVDLPGFTANTEQRLLKRIQEYRTRQKMSEI